ncbi:MAG: hypothetical protein Q8K98_11400 [Bacteroidota bacterium]|nr:hypothetical protein [Bacteroidota bacterium]
MFEHTLEYIGLQYTKFLHRKEKDTSQELTDFLTRSRSILIVLPVDYEDAQAAGNAFRTIRDTLENKEITIVTEGIRSTSLSELPKSKVIRISASHINKFFLPRQHFLERIRQAHFDVTIDLNLDFVLYAAYICKATDAKYRIGLADRAADTFYNVQFNFNKSQPASYIYQQFVQYLKMF